MIDSIILKRVNVISYSVHNLQTVLGQDCYKYHLVGIKVSCEFRVNDFYNAL